MATNRMEKTAHLRDYSKPMVLDLRGEKGLRTYIKIAKSPRIEYNAKAAAEKAANNLRMQGLNVSASYSERNG